MATITSRRALARYFDVTNLKMDATAADMRQLCEQTLAAEACSVMVYPAWIPLCAEILRGTEVLLGAVAGFPSGQCATQAKLADIDFLAKAGAHEVDFVLQHAAFRAGDYAQAEADARTCVRAARSLGLVSKIIVETAYLSDTQRLDSLRLCEAVEADFIKTSTGFASRGANLEDIRCFAQHRQTAIRIKAAGGMTCLQDALDMIAAGADRLGASKALAFLDEWDNAQPPA